MESRKSQRVKAPQQEQSKRGPSSPKITKKIKIATEHQLETLADIANKMRIECIKMTTQAKSGHPTSCASLADFVSAIFFDPSGMKYFPKDPGHRLNDRFVLSKGHAAPLLYSAWKQCGYFTEEQIMTLRSIDSNIEGHPTTDHPFVDVATGSLGQGLGVACGLAYSCKHFEKTQNKIYCALGDGEIQEGSVWEAANFASKYQLDNVIAFVDCNQFGQSNTLGHDKIVLDNYKKKFESFGWASCVIDAHNYVDIIDALDKANKSKLPYAIIGKTFKGRNCGKDVENNMSYHGKPLGDKADEAIQHLQSLIKNQDSVLRPLEPLTSETQEQSQSKVSFQLTEYDNSKLIATREGYGNALKNLGDQDQTFQVIGLDADLKNSTFSDRLFKAHKDKFVECFIAEQNMVSVGSGLAARKKIPFCSTFACFLSRAYDQIRMAGISKLNIKFCGSHCGVSIGDDGSSQMALEDIAMFRAIPNSVVLYPTDAVSTEKAVQLACDYNGIVYIRTGRNPVEILYKNDEEFQIGKAKILRKSDNDQVLIVSSGITVNESFKAYESLKAQGINVRICDLFSIKPVDKQCLLDNACNGKIVVVEDHYQQGGIYEAVCSALSEEVNIKIYSIAVQNVPKSGKPLEILNLMGISQRQIEQKIQQIL